jgi:hypothetical protein
LLTELDSACAALVPSGDTTDFDLLLFTVEENTCEDTGDVLDINVDVDDAGVADVVTVSVDD